MPIKEASEFNKTLQLTGLENLILTTDTVFTGKKLVQYKAISSRF